MMRGLSCSIFWHTRIIDGHGCRDYRDSSSVADAQRQVHDRRQNRLPRLIVSQPQ